MLEMNHEMTEKTFTARWHKTTFLVYYHPLILAPMMEISTVEWQNICIAKMQPYDGIGGNLVELVHLQ